MSSAAAPTAGDGVRACAGLETDLGWALGTVLRGYAKAAADVFADLPGGPRGYQVLAAASGEDLGTQLALAHQLGVDRTVMTYLLDDLEHTGLIERRPDPADRRVRRVAVTERGRAMLLELDQRLDEAEDKLLAVLDDQDRATFRTLLRRLATHAGADVASACRPADRVAEACEAVEDGLAVAPPRQRPGAGAVRPRPAVRPRRVRAVRPRMFAVALGPPGQ